MRFHRLSAWLCLIVLAGCQSTPPPPPPEVAVDSVVVQREFDEVWQATKTVLVEQDYEIYTRDKRGMFVAYTKKKGTFSIPNRARITVVLERVTNNTTRVSVEAVQERYRMPLLKHPGWKEQPKVDLTERRQEVLRGIEAANTTTAAAPAA